MSVYSPTKSDKAAQNQNGNFSFATELPINWQDEIRELARKKNALILAHNYQLAEIQDVADFTGDSLALSRISAETDYDTIIFCGVHFMAETAKILQSHKKVILPHKRAGCSLADSITAEQLREWKSEHPEALVVSYVNTTAAVKAETDICCTSSNAVDVVNQIDPEREILFLPDQFLGAYVRAETGRKNMHIWSGECHVHAGIHPYQIEALKREYPDSPVYIHPECGCSTTALYAASQGILDTQKVKFLSTGAMLDAAKNITTDRVLIATEIGIIHQLQQVNPTVNFTPVNPQAICSYMKMITPIHLWNALQEQGPDYQIIDVDSEVSQKARHSIEAMLYTGNPGQGE